MGEKETSFAVIGCGLAGLAVCYELFHSFPSANVDIFSSEKQRPASQVASGLLHLFHGTRASLPPLAREGFQATKELLEFLQEQSPHPIFKEIEIVRPVRYAEQRKAFLTRTRQYPLELEFNEFKMEKLYFQEALIIKKAINVDAPAYLGTLRTYLQQKGARFLTEEISKERLSSYDKVILCCGSQVKSVMEALSGILPELETIPTKGQVALCQSTDVPPIAINAKSYLVPSLSEHRYLVGATFERQFTQVEPADCFERQVLLEEAVKLWPSLQASSLIWQSAVRLSGPEHLPFIASYKQNLLAVGGLGSKGLLYHRLMARYLMRLLKNSPSGENWQIFPLRALIDNLNF